MDPWNRSSILNCTSKGHNLAKGRYHRKHQTDQSYYRVDEAKGSNKSFDHHLENIAPCGDELWSYNSVNTGRVLNLDPDYEFIWDAEEEVEPEMVIPPMGWPAVNGDDC